MIVSIGDVVVDVIVNGVSMNYGTDSKASIRTFAGGQSNNVAAWVAYHDVHSTLIGKVGNDPFGRFLIDEAKKQGIEALLEVEGQAETGKILVVVDKHTGERTMITDRGANLLLDVNVIEARGDRVRECNLLYLSGYSLFSKVTKEAVDVAKGIAVDEKIPIALDPSSVYYLREKKGELLSFLKNITFLFPNYEEGMLLTGEDEPKRIVKRLREFVPYPILKLGERGCMLYEDGSFVSISSEQVKVEDTVGAGDCFVGTFLASYMKKADVIDSAHTAVKMASYQVGIRGARPLLK
ncbi:PfkB family carbohydrate kinase [Bacillus timonensis]|nr:PfkB family carbohydrate kinase [Bacillus timonensis]